MRYGVCQIRQQLRKKALVVAHVIGGLIPRGTPHYLQGDFFLSVLHMSLYKN